ncbi:rhomboid family intramembrane serine protease [Moraxella nasovis]|uniref:rhomboid family intramembrane serine protease n=1 Tax=Moraxella nasovis TaxID=2904121 RepID=UPI001F62079F|nr:rhomboid family intramembrane serine protease [Moraxella nasovis]UNU72787.1 rhomboid family intramembrane serine protease [Moraxella nasovis]
MNHTTAIIIITVIASILAWQNNSLMGRLIFDPTRISRYKQFDRFITHGFIHADGMHLLFNMFTLYFFGRAIERFYLAKLGQFGFLAFYVIAIIIAAIPSYLKHKNNPRYLSLGASGGVSAVLFAFILFAPWETLYLFAILPIPAIVFAIAYTAYSLYAQKRGTGNVDHLAHLTGAAFGIIASILIEPSLVQHFFSHLLHPSF